MSQAITDALTRHQIYLQRYATGRVQNALPFVRQLANRLRARILEGGMTEYQLQRLQILYADILRLTAETSAAIEAQLTLGLDELANHEAEFAHKILAGAVTVETAKASPEIIRAAISTKPMRLIQGDEIVSVTMQDAFRQFGGAVARDVRQSVQAGIVEGKTTQQIAREVHGMVNSRSRRQAEALVRTVTNHVGNTARAEVFWRNSDIITEERWTSTLDGRTSLVCTGRDGKVFPVGQGPYPPAHYNCRSVRVPIVDPKLRIPGLDGASERASMTGPVSAKLTYDGFLRRQSAEFQNEVLGVERAKLFRSGMPIDKFTDASGKTYTLAELKAIDSLNTVQ